MTKIISRKEAKARGLGKYFTGKPCSRGHVAERYLAGGCTVCQAEKAKERYHEDEGYREKLKAATRKWQKKNPEKTRAWATRWRKANPEKFREGCRRWRKANPEVVRQNYLDWVEKNPERYRELNRRSSLAWWRRNHAKKKG